MVAAGVRVLLLVRLFHVVVVFRVLRPGFGFFLLGLFVHFFHILFLVFFLVLLVLLILPRPVRLLLPHPPRRLPRLSHLPLIPLLLPLRPFSPLSSSSSCSSSSSSSFLGRHGSISVSCIVHVISLLLHFPDADECIASSPVCHVNSLCNNTISSYTCTCKFGYTGDDKTCAGS